MEGLLLLLVGLAVGYAMIWVIINERAGSRAGQIGWLALKPPSIKSRLKGRGIERPMPRPAPAAQRPPGTGPRRR